MQVSWDIEDGKHVPILEAELDGVNVFIAGYPPIEMFEGFAVSQVGVAKIDYVGFIDAMGGKVALSSHESDPFRRAAYEALMAKAARDGIEASFKTELSFHAEPSRSPQQEYGTYWGRP